MQLAFGYGSAEMARWHDRLRPALVAVELPRRPVAQLVKSMISGRTRDAVSAAAFARLKAAFGSAASLAAAQPRAVEQVIADVTFASDKAAYVVEALRQLSDSRYGYRLDALGDIPVSDGLAFLEALPGVGRKVSASTLNASTLAMPVMIVDTHVLRVLRRLGAIPRNADYRAASETVTETMPGWSGADFLHFHVELKLLGQTICRPDLPRCGTCPLAGDCGSKGDFASSP